MSSTGENGPSPSNSSREYAVTLTNVQLQPLIEGKDSPATGTQKVYGDVSSLLFQLAVFAGGITFGTQFVIACPETRPQVLLGLTSQLFLGSLLGLVIVYFLMYGFQEDDPLPPVVHVLVLAQFIVVGIMDVVAFALLVTAVLVAGNVNSMNRTAGNTTLGNEKSGSATTGILGIVLFGVLVVGSLILGCIAGAKRRHDTIAENNTGNAAATDRLESGTNNTHAASGNTQNWLKRCKPDFKWLRKLISSSSEEDLNGRQRGITVLFLFLELVAVACLLVFGAHEANDTKVQWGCVKAG